MQRPDVEKYEAMARGAANALDDDRLDFDEADYKIALFDQEAEPDMVLALCAYIKHLEAAPATVWAVVYGNYDPAEVDSLWASKSLAERRADALGDDWRVIEWKVRAEEAVK